MTRHNTKSAGSLKALRTDPGRLPLSVVITTYNEEVNIADCLRSVLWADEILLVDSFSTDRTLEYARQFPIQILEREYFGSAAQKNWSLDKVQHDWVLILDADERVTEPLAREILRLVDRQGDPAVRQSPRPLSESPRARRPRHRATHTDSPAPPGSLHLSLRGAVLREVPQLCRMGGRPGLS